MTASAGQENPYEHLDFNNIDHVMDWVFEQCDWPTDAKLLYLLLYRYRRNPKVDLGVRGLAKEFGGGKNTFMAATRTLQSLGAITVVKHRLKGRRVNLPNEYIVHPPWTAVQFSPRTPRGMHASNPSKNEERRLGLPPADEKEGNADDH